MNKSMITLKEQDNVFALINALKNICISFRQITLHQIHFYLFIIFKYGMLFLH